MIVPWVRGIFAVSALALCSCGEPSLTFAPPEQRPALEDYKAPASRVLNMDDGDAPMRFVRDISPQLAANWRWTGQSPAVRLRVRSTENLKYVIDFSLPDVTFKDTGPVTIEFTVNDRLLATEHYATAGEKHFEKPVPAGWLIAGQDAVVGARIDKMWVSKDDGAKFGFILTRIGFTQ